MCTTHFDISTLTFGLDHLTWRNSTMNSAWKNLCCNVYLEVFLEEGEVFKQTSTTQVSKTR